MKRYKRLLLILILTLAGMLNSMAQPLLDEAGKSKILSSLSESRLDWQQLGISGKLKMEGLPLSPSVKIYMDRGNLLIMSLRVPLMGEVGRLEVTPEKFLIVNKMKKIYVEESLSSLKEYFPWNLTDLQELMVGNIILPGYEPEACLSAELIDVYEDSDGDFSLVPNDEAALEGFSYGYLLDSELFNRTLLVIPDANPDINVMLIYDYLEKGYDITALYQTSRYAIEARLELENPVFNPSPIETLTLGKKYNRVSLEQFMKTF